MADRSTDGINPTIMWIIWGALLMSLLLYGGVLTVMETEQTMEPGQFQILLIVLSLTAVGEIPIIFVFRKITFFDKLEQGEFEDREEVGQQYYVASILTWALCESIAVYGFVIAFLGGKIIYYPAFAAVAMALMLYFRPKLEEQMEAFGS